MTTYDDADGFLLIVGLLILVGLFFLIASTFYIVKLMISSCFKIVSNNFVVDSRQHKINPNDFWDEPDMGTYITLPSGTVRID